MVVESLRNLLPQTVKGWCFFVKTYKWKWI